MTAPVVVLIVRQRVTTAEIWDTEAGDAAQATIVLAELVDTQFEKKMRMGDIIRIVDKSNPAVRVKTEDASATYANITETNQAITINRQAYVAFLIEDILDVQAQTDLRQMYTSKAGYSLMAFVEGDATSGLVSLPSSFSQLVGTLGSDPTDDDLLQAVTLLDQNDVPREDRFFYCAPATHTALLKIEKFVNQQHVGQAAAERAITKAKVGMVYGAPVYMSSLADNNPAAASQSYSWFCHKRGVALIRQRMPRTHVDYVLLETGFGVLVDVIYQFAERLIAPKTLGGGTSSDVFNVGVRGA